WDRRDRVVALDPQHLLDEIGFALDVAAPRRWLDAEAAVVLGRRADRAAERFEDGAALIRRHVQPAEPGEALGAQHIAAPPFRRSSGDDDFGWLAAAQFEDEPCRDLDAGADKGRVDAALEAIARVADDFEAAAGRRGAHRVEQRRLDKDLGR